jgi:hypothetical protein
MSESSSARFGFGLSTLCFGAISIVWRGSDLWKHALQIGGPFAAGAAWGCAALLCAGGLLLVAGRDALGSALVGIGGSLLTLSCLVDITAAPASYASYIDAFELFAIVIGAAAVYAHSTADARPTRLFARAAKISFAFCNLSYAAAQIVFFSYTASLIPAWIPGASFWTALTTLAFVLVATALLIGRQVALALHLLTAMVALFALLVWVPRLLVEPKLENWGEFMLTWVIAGAAWTLATVRTTALRRMRGASKPSRRRQGA